MQEFIGTSILFFSDVYSRNRKSAASLEACLLMLIKTLAFSVPMHTFLDHFQMPEDFSERACNAGSLMQQSNSDAWMNSCPYLLLHT